MVQQTTIFLLLSLCAPPRLSTPAQQNKTKPHNHYPHRQSFLQANLQPSHNTSTPNATSQNTPPPSKQSSTGNNRTQNYTYVQPYERRFQAAVFFFGFEYIPNNLTVSSTYTYIYIYIPPHVTRDALKHC